MAKVTIGADGKMVAGAGNIGSVQQVSSTGSRRPERCYGEGNDYFARRDHRHWLQQARRQEEHDAQEEAVRAALAIIMRSRY